MTHFLDYFFVGWQQATLLIYVGVIWLWLSALGAGVTARESLTEANFVYGWAVLSTVLTLTGVFGLALPTPLRWALLAVVLASAAAWFFARRRGQKMFAAGTWRVALLMVPVLVITAAMVPSQWDEFSHWLPAAKFLLHYDRFPSVDYPVTGPTMLPAYPYGWPFLAYTVGELARHFVANSGGIFNLLLLAAFGMAAVRVFLEAAGRDTKAPFGWGLAALALLFGTLFNPTFIQKIVLTAYSDVSSAVAVGFAALLGWRLTARLAENDGDGAWREAWQLALVFALLVNLRMTNIVHFVVITVSLGIVSVLDPKIQFAAFAKRAAVIVAPALIVYATWRFHVSTEMAQWPAAEPGLMPFANWNFALIPRILEQMLVVAGKKFAFFAIMFTAVLFGVRGAIRMQGTFDRLAIITGLAFLGNTAFLFTTYVAAFAASNAVTVVSFWRYSTHTGLVAVLFLAYALGYGWRRFGAKLPRRVLAGLGIVLVLAAPVGFARKIRFDLEPPKPHAIAVAKDLVSLVPKDAKLYIMDPRGTGETGVITRFIMDRPETPWMSAFHGPNPQNIRAFIRRLRPQDMLLVHSVVDGVSAALGIDLPANQSTLLARSNGKWHIVRSWPYPPGHKP